MIADDRPNPEAANLLSGPTPTEQGIEGVNIS